MEQGAAREPGLPRRPGPSPDPGAVPAAGPRGRPGGVVYWHALRPEAGPCRPP